MRYGTTVEDILAANGITNPSLIYVGQVLTIPTGGAPSQPSQPVKPAPGTGDRVHVVKPGENLFRIALRYNLDYYYLARYNNISNPSLVYVGQRILIPSK
jgi:LysM repeat protein